VFAAGFVAVTAYILYRTQVRFATDAPLVTGVAIALFGMQRAFTSSSATHRTLGYARITRRTFDQLLRQRPGRLVGARLRIFDRDRARATLARTRLPRALAGWCRHRSAIVGAWLFWVAISPGGEQSLRVLLWYNLLGRFVKLEAADHLVYATRTSKHAGRIFFQPAGVSCCHGHRS
jgi:hypothetical protein